MIHIFCFLFMLITIFSIRLPQAFAAPISLTISPPKFDLAISPGQPSTHTVRLTNNHESELSFKTAILDFAPRDKTGGIEVAREIKGHSARDWFQAEPREFTLKPGETRYVTVTITPPSELIPGSYFAVVMLQAQNALKENATESPIAPWIGSLFFIRYGDPVDLGEDALIAKILNQPRLHLGGDLPVAIEVENNTNFHLPVRTAFRLSNIVRLGSPSPVDAEQIIMPGSSRIFRLTVKEPPFGIQRGIIQTSTGSYNRGVTTKPIVTLNSLTVIILIAAGIATHIVFRNLRNIRLLAKRQRFRWKRRNNTSRGAT